MSTAGIEHNESPTPRVLEMLAETESLIARRFKSLRSLVIVQDGSLLCARGYNRCYDDGYSSGYNNGYPVGNSYNVKHSVKNDSENHTSQNFSQNPSSIAPIHSVTKSVVALLTGILLDQGLIESVKQPLPELLGSRSHYVDRNSQVSRLTLHHLLSMTTGFLWRDARVGLEPMAGRMVQQKDWVKFILSLPITRGKVGLFQYNSAASHLLSAIIEEAAGEPAFRFADKNLFFPMGITESAWDSDPHGVSIGGWGLSLSALSMAKLGQLCLDQGKHGQNQLISEQWIKQMWTPYSEALSLHGRSQPVDYDVARYGYQWWIRGKSRLQLYCAEGLGGQKIFCIPDLRAVIVTGSDLAGRRTSLWPLFEDHWIPSLVAGA